jgi:uncharacterized protein DUF5681
MKKKTSQSLELKERLGSGTPEERDMLLAGLPYEIGFGKPPKSMRFRPGQSGNRRGRPKGSRNWGAVLQDELDAKIEVADSGRRRKLPKGQVALRQVANKAAAGDLKALATIIELLRKTGQLKEAPARSAPVFDESDLNAAGELMRLINDTSPPEPAVATEEGGQ